MVTACKHPGGHGEEEEAYRLELRLGRLLILGVALALLLCLGSLLMALVSSTRDARREHRIQGMLSYVAHVCGSVVGGFGLV